LSETVIKGLPTFLMTSYSKPSAARDKFRRCSAPLSASNSLNLWRETPLNFGFAMALRVAQLPKVSAAALPALR